jgi:hypothetical protein
VRSSRPPTETAVGPFLLDLESAGGRQVLQIVSKRGDIPVYDNAADSSAIMILRCRYLRLLANNL